MDYKNLPFHTTSEKIVQIISDKVQNNDLKLFRVIVAYYLGVVASICVLALQVLVDKKYL